MKLESSSIRLRLVEKEDAEFILKLRLDQRYNKYLSSVSPDLEAQISWIESYKHSEKAGEQYYFIIERRDGLPIGTVRIYDLREDSFCWGSWILNKDKTRYSALESAFLVYEFGFDVLGFKKSHYEVMKGNERVVAFHQKMGAVIIGEDEDNLFFTISKTAVDTSKVKLSALIGVK